MAVFNSLNKRKFVLFSISFILTVLVASNSLNFTLNLTTNNQITPISNESEIEEFEPQISGDSYIFYEDTTGIASNVYVSGDYAYLADGQSGLAIIDISDPTNPGTPIYENTTGNANDVFVRGDFAYVADMDSGLAIINISDPTNPGTPIYEDTNGIANSVYLSGDYAYVADLNEGLAIINISDPTNPGTPVYEGTSDFAYDVYVSGDYAYLIDMINGFAVINISDPTNPGIPVYEDTLLSSSGVYVSGDYAYVADRTGGLAIIDISDPTNPGIPIYKDTTGSSFGVYVNGDYAYVADFVSGLAIINISDPTNPGEPVYELTKGVAYGAYARGDYAYIADYKGLAVIQIQNRIDTTNPSITNAPSDLLVESNYTGQTLSWTATDINPDTYTIELLGSGIVAGPTAWTSGVPITYNIPNGLISGFYVYMVNFTDSSDNSITVSVSFTVKDDGVRIPGASFEMILIMSIGTVASIIVWNKKKHRSNLE